jgi:AsmA protein
MKRWMKILLALVGLVVLGLASIPLFVNANTFRPTIEAQLTAVLGRSVKLGDLSLSIFSGSLVAKDLSVADDPSFSAAPFLTAKEVRIGVFLRPLIFSRKVDLKGFQIKSPQITLIRGIFQALVASPLAAPSRTELRKLRQSSRSSTCDASSSKTVAP